MANIKSIVKVMNFQALLHVDKAHRTADKYLLLEKDVNKMINIIENNKNLILDKKFAKIDPNNPRLRIFIGSDLGFCGVINASVNRELLKEDGSNDIVIVGRKIHTDKPIKYEVSRDDFEDKFSDITALFEDGIKNKRYSGVDIFYNHYHNMAQIEPMMRTIFPVESKKDDEDEDLFKDDFLIEGGDVEKILQELTITYLNYELKSAIVSSYASENILRQQATNESLKHIDELEEQKRWAEHKMREKVAVSRVIESYTKLTFRE